MNNQILTKGEKDMYPNVRAELARKGWTIGDLATATGIRYNTLAEKLKGTSELTLGEAMTIKTALEVDITLEQLFYVEVA